VLAASLFSTVPWIALNTSETRSVERFKTLPLGQGRVESTIAYWYFQHGDLALAKSWIRKSILASPENSRAVDLFGRIALAERDPVLAARAYRIAVGMRPDKPDYRMQLVFALLASGEVEEGLAHSDTLLAMRPEDPLAWAERALLLRAAGQPDAARVAAARADGLRPGATAFADSLARGVLPVSGAAR
jgi:Tfp pilus assembly protein PilF